MGDPGKHASGLTDSTERAQEPEDGLYFFPDQKVTAEEVRRILDEGTNEQKAWVVSHLLRFAQWDDIWAHVDREVVRDMFPTLELPDTLRTAWARILKVEVGSPSA